MLLSTTTNATGSLLLINTANATASLLLKPLLLLLMLLCSPEEFATPRLFARLGPKVGGRAEKDAHKDAHKVPAEDSSSLPGADETSDTGRISR